jgi:type IV secretory pathway VirB2 component (pilin)
MLLLVSSFLLSSPGSGSGSGSGPGLGFTPTPDPTQLPGFTVLQDLTNGVEGWALIAAVVGVVIGAIIWAFGHYSQNWQQAYSGRKGVLVSGLAAVLIGGAPHIVNFLVQKGGKVG